MEEQPRINIEKFVLFHRKRIELLKKLLEEKTHGRLIYQIAFLGIESLAKLLYPEERDPGKRFIELFSKEIGKNRATHLYKFWRCPLTHEGFITSPWTTLEAWEDEDIGFIDFPQINSIRSSTEYPPGSILAIYKNLISYLEDYFKNKNTKIFILPAKSTHKLN